MKYHKNVYRSLAMITQFGINMLVPIIVCSFIGLFLDRYLGTSFFMILFFFMGALAGGRNIYIFARKIFRTPPERDHCQKTASSKKEEACTGHKDDDSV